MNVNPNAVDPTEIAEEEGVNVAYVRRIVIDCHHAWAGRAETPGKPLAW